MQGEYPLARKLCWENGDDWSARRLFAISYQRSQYDERYSFSFSLDLYRERFYPDWRPGSPPTLSSCPAIAQNLPAVQCQAKTTQLVGTPNSVTSESSASPPSLIPQTHGNISTQTPQSIQVPVFEYKNSSSP